MNNYTKLSQFRSLMGEGVYQEDIRRIWGESYLSSIKKRKKNIPNTNPNPFLDEKIRIAKESILSLLVSTFVKFIGISGSVASGFAKEDDDIDIFIVVRNGSMWIYRALVQARNIFHRKIRMKGEDNVKDKLCLNLIAEEQGITFDSDIFNFNELMYLIPIYNEKYIKYIYSRNKWLEDEYNVKKELLITKIKPQKRVNVLIRIMNTFFYYLQLTYMKLAKHRPDFKRLKENSKKGRIEFFPKRFRERKIKNYGEKFG